MKRPSEGTKSAPTRCCASVVAKAISKSLSPLAFTISSFRPSGRSELPRERFSPMSKRPGSSPRQQIERGLAHEFGSLLREVVAGALNNSALV
jgi:hypothetical protein